MSSEFQEKKELTWMHDHQRFLNCLMDFTSIPAAVICHGFHYISKLMYETLHFRRLKCSWFLVTNMKPRMSFDRTTWAGREHRPLPGPVGHSYITSWIYPDILMLDIFPNLSEVSGCAPAGQRANVLRHALENGQQWSCSVVNEMRRTWSIGLLIL